MTKKLIYIVLLLLTTMSCEDVIDVDVETAEPRLVIDASLDWVKGTSGNLQFIRLTLTAPYFDDSVPPANNAQVMVTDTKGNTFNFIEEGSTGIYRINNFVPEIGETYTLNIEFEGETYIASETMMPVVPIEFVEQENDGGFSGDETELKAFYTDPAGIDNYYLFDFQVLNNSTSNLEVYDDEFTDGNQIFAFYSDEDLEAGDEVIIRNSGISERTFNYFTILLQQTDENAGDPFDVQPATVRGNCVNTTIPDHYPLGYFRATETDVFSYIIQ